MTRNPKTKLTQEEQIIVANSLINPPQPNVELKKSLIESQNAIEEDDELFNPLSLVIGDTINDLSVVYKIKEELTKESDRGCCLVAAAYIEIELKNIISNFLIDMPQKESNELFNYTGPIGSFSSKIKLAYSLGLISKEISFFINQLRSIRNIAAHLEDPFDFRENKITDHIKNIIPSLNDKYQCIREELIEKIIVIISTLHYNRTNTFKRPVIFPINSYDY